MYAEPRRGLRLDECLFYHTTDLPGLGTVKGWWDLRKVPGAYLGNVDFAGQRVLEVGPASGFLTAYMDQQGANVVALEQPESAVWEFVPLDIRNPDWKATINAKIVNQKKLKNAFWLTHEQFGLSAKAIYCNIADLPEEVGDFDISVLAMVLTHMRDPIKAIEVCARRARKKLIITERFHVPEETQQYPMMWYIPKKGGRRDTWWYFTKRFYDQLLEGIGFSKVTYTDVTVTVKGAPYSCTAIVAEW